MSTPVWLVPAIVAALLAAIPVVILLLRPYLSRLTPDQRAAILGSVKGVKDVLSVVAPITPTDIDNKLVEALALIEADLGKLSQAEKDLAAKQFISLVARDHAGSGDAVAAEKLKQAMLGGAE